MVKVFHYIPVRHDISRQTNDCSPVRVMQHKVMSTQPLGLRPSGWVDLGFSNRDIGNTSLCVASPEQANSHSSGVIYHGEQGYNQSLSMRETFTWELLLPIHKQSITQLLFQMSLFPALCQASYGHETLPPLEGGYRVTFWPHSGSILSWFGWRGPVLCVHSLELFLWQIVLKSKGKDLGCSQMLVIVTYSKDSTLMLVFRVMHSELKFSQRQGKITRHRFKLSPLGWAR